LADVGLIWGLFLVGPNYWGHSVIQQGVAASILRVGTLYNLDLVLVLVFLVIQHLEACGILLEYFVAASIFFIGAIFIVASSPIYE
jgi:hypothetical protein